ncbi:hypothetical protein [Marinicauda pacifica]|uniref:hypothetical protein n=1 Tax=Marinicauda pacifica TaxID=1133559 RepID=UPI0035C85567
MAIHTAKAFPCPELHELESLYLIENDLRLVRQLVELTEFVGGYLTTTLNVRNKAAVTSALVHYRRIFTSGVRQKLLKSDIPASWIALHDEVIAVTDKHVAHSINEYEVPHVTLSVRELGSSITVTGLRYGMMGTTEISACNFRRLSDLCCLLIEHVVVPRREGLEKRVLERAAGLSEQELRDLPDGLLVGKTKSPDPSKKRRRS